MISQNLIKTKKPGKGANKAKKLGRRLAYFEDSYRVIGASENHVDIIRNSYKATWDKLAPWMPFSMFLCITMSRNSLDLNGRGKYSNGKSYPLVSNVLLEY